MRLTDERRTVSLMVDYLFGKGVSRVLPKSGFRLVRSRKSWRVKLVFHEERLFATIKPSGAMALTIYGANLLSKSPRFSDNFVTVADDAVGFVHGGKSVFCKFVLHTGSNVLPGGEVVVADKRGHVLGVGTAVLNGKFIRQFSSGIAVKVRVGAKQ
jgi:7-cyano-7-deazaguanine tRNA-ribosyltransferase